jgi:hypothetical protein
VDPVDFVAQADQAKAGLGTFSGILGSYFRQLIAEGFERAEAFELVQDVQDYWLRGSSEGPAADPDE